MLLCCKIVIMLSMKKLGSIIFVLFLLPQVLWGQTNKQLTQTVRGIVKDRASSEPLPSISVKIINTQIGAMTNEDGRFVLEDVPIGRYAIEASSTGYESSIIKE